MDRMSSKWKTIEQIVEARREERIVEESREASITQQDIDEAERKERTEARKAALGAAEKKKAEATGKSAVQIRRENHAKKMEKQRLNSLKKKKKQQEKALRQLELNRAPALGAKAATPNPQGQKRKAEAGSGSATKKQKMEPAVKKVPAPKVKPEAATTKRKIKWEDVRGRIREVVCLD